MQEPNNSWRQCPTRPDGAEVLIEHRINGGTCQSRQRKHFHKCYSCVHRNSAAEVRGTVTLPPVGQHRVAASAGAPVEESAPSPTKTAAASARQAG